jgi:HK97 gp10 family phage protein
MIRVKVEGLNELIENMGTTKTMVKPLIAGTLNQVATRIKYDARNTAPIAFGKLKGGISHTVKKSSLEGIVWSKEKYGVFVERGTRPHFPPIEPLKRWSALKLGNANLAWAVAKKISRVGTKAQPFMQPALDKNIHFMKRKFGELAQQLITVMKYGK